MNNKKERNVKINKTKNETICMESFIPKKQKKIQKKKN